MIVVSDTSPLSSLYLIDHLFLLPAIFGKIIVPEKVWEEILVLESDFGRDLSHLKSAEWLQVCPVTDDAEVLRLQQFLDAGESQAIVLAKELHADYLLVDEREGRQAAVQEGLKVIGVLGIIIQSKSLRLIPEVRPLLEDLRTKAQFHIHDKLFNTVLGCAGELDEDQVS